MLRRAETDPSAAVDQLTRDIARLRSDMDNIRSAAGYRGRQWAQGTRQQLSDTTNRAYENTSRFVRRHPGASTGIGVGALALVGAIAASAFAWRAICKR